MQTILNIVAILVFILLLSCIFFLRKKGLLQDNSTADPKPYSFSRVQVTWWTVVIIGSFLYIFTLTHGISSDDPQFHILNPTALILLGISAGTLGVGRVIDDSQETHDTDRHQDLPSEGFWRDILSDENGISIHRLQCLFFNLIYGLIFIYMVFENRTMPDFSEWELTIMGISSATYIGLKAAENTNPNKAEG